MNRKFAFSLIELSIVILVIGVLIAGVAASSRIIKFSRLQTAQTLTHSSPVASIPNMLVWYETSLETSFLVNEQENNTYISNWYDNSPQASTKNNASQSTQSNQPKYIKDIFNDAIPAIRFDGGDYMPFDGAILAKTNYTVFVVEQRRAAGTGSALAIIGGTTPTQHNNFHMIYDNDTTFRIGHYSYDNDYTVPAYTTPIVRMHTAMFSTIAGQKYWLNGGSSADATASLNTTALVSNSGASLGRMYNGSSYLYYNGDIAEIIIYGRALKDEERQAIESYLSKKYKITIS